MRYIYFFYNKNNVKINNIKNLCVSHILLKKKDIFIDCIKKNFSNLIKKKTLFINICSKKHTQKKKKKKTRTQHRSTNPQFQLY
jgi:hypothetical protein